MSGHNSSGVGSYAPCAVGSLRVEVINMAENQKQEARPLMPGQITKMKNLLKETADETYAQDYFQGSRNT